MNDRFVLRLRKIVSAACVYSTLATTTAFAQEQTPTAPQPQNPSGFNITIPKSHDPISPYTPSHVPPPELSNSPRLDSLIKDGKLYLSLKDAISLALENNLDVAIANQNLAAAEANFAAARAVVAAAKQAGCHIALDLGSRLLDGAADESGVEEIGGADQGRGRQAQSLDRGFRRSIRRRADPAAGRGGQAAPAWCRPHSGRSPGTRR